jgi:D-tyrosyl-tRNA(Tyr) deacylase
MRAVVQRVSRASVAVEGHTVGSIGRGLLVLLAVGKPDTAATAAYMADKIANLRIFEDETGKMNRSVLDIAGAALAVSQFTLYGDVRKGRRPSFVASAPPELAEPLYQQFLAELRRLGLPTETGVFRADMQVSLVNDGPVTILLDSDRAL